MDALWTQSSLLATEQFKPYLVMLWHVMQFNWSHDMRFQACTLVWNEKKNLMMTDMEPKTCFDGDRFPVSVDVTSGHVLWYTWKTDN